MTLKTAKLRGKSGKKVKLLEKEEKRIEFAGYNLARTDNAATTRKAMPVQNKSPPVKK
jgi:hypothetical protein